VCVAVHEIQVLECGVLFLQLAIAGLASVRGPLQVVALGVRQMRRQYVVHDDEADRPPVGPVWGTSQGVRARVYVHERIHTSVRAKKTSSPNGRARVSQQPNGERCFNQGRSLDLQYVQQAAECDGVCVCGRRQR